MTIEMEIENMAQSEDVKQRCPNCNSVIPVHKGYITWCECGWNLTPYKPQTSSGKLGKLYDAMGKKIGRLQLQQLINGRNIKPTLTVSKIFAYLISTMVYAIMLVWAILGGWLLVAGWPNIFLSFVGLLSLLVAWMTRPRLPKMPSRVVAREQIPTVYEVFDMICKELKTSNVSGIVITDEFNASIRIVGTKRKKVISLGLPLLWILNGNERISVFSHEVAHAVNGDGNRGIFIGGALNTLETWYAILRPDHIYDPESSLDGTTWLAGIFMIPVNLFMFGLTKNIYLIMYGLVHLLWQDKQRAEFLADYLAANMSGTDATISFLEKLHYTDLHGLALQKAYYKKKEQDFFAELEAEVQNMPERERERIRRIQLLKGSQLDSTHPPTAHRIEFLKSRSLGGRLVISEEIMKQLEKELAAFREQINSSLMQKYANKLHY